ncbi:MAG: DUF6766 family protein [Actinomycetota bacterium]
MSGGAWAMAFVMVTTVGALTFLLFSMARSIRDERTDGRSVWREFGLSVALLALFLVSWGAHGISEWQVFTDEQHSHGESPEVGDFMSELAKSTLENWQSEFLQLFAFVTLAALYIHKGSAESKDGEEKIEASLRRIEEQLGTLPTEPARKGTDWALPETPLEAAEPTT